MPARPAAHLPPDPEDAQHPKGPVDWLKGYQAAAEAAQALKPKLVKFPRPLAYFRLDAAKFSIFAYKALAQGGKEAVANFALGLAECLATGDPSLSALGMEMLAEAAEFSEKARQAAKARWTKDANASGMRTHADACDGNASALGADTERNADGMPYQSKADHSRRENHPEGEGEVFISEATARRPPPLPARPAAPRISDPPPGINNGGKTTRGNTTPLPLKDLDADPFVEGALPPISGARK